MSRLVAQLLRVARLDAEPMAVGNVIDLGQVAGKVVEHIAPLATRRQGSVAFEPCEAIVQVWRRRAAASGGVSV